jgi:sporulation protein YlmC with PRC-barrel domain
MSATPLIGRFAVVTMGGTVIGLAQNIAADINADLIKEFALGSDKPLIIASGNKHFKIKVDKMYIDGTYATQLLNGTAADFVITPQGTTFTGKPKYTLKNVVLITYNYKNDQKGIILESVSGEGTDWQVGTV